MGLSGVDDPSILAWAAKQNREEDIIEMLDLSQAKRPLAAQKSLSIELPILSIELINQEAKRLGVTPQIVAQTSLAEHLAFSRSN